MDEPPEVRTVRSGRPAGRPRVLILVGLAVTLGVEPGAPQSDYGNRLGIREGGRVSYYPAAPSMRTDAFAPSLKKWYMPQEVANQYRWQWETTNYALERYSRYLATDQEGDYHYDLYGRLLTRGWLIYDWQQRRPRTSEGNLLHKTAQYKDLFGSLVVSSDAKGRHHFRVSIGDEISTTLTPMTFRKTAFNGAQFDYMSDRVSATALMSRINVPLVEPTSSFIDEFTSLVGLRAVWNVADFVRIGGTFVNAHNARSSTQPFDGSPFTGRLSSHQSGARINRITVRITDDSPEDGEGGPALYAHEIEITTRVGELDTVLVGSQIGFYPRVSGGVRRDGFLVAEGDGESARIRLTYVLADMDPVARDDLETVVPLADVVNNITKVRFRMVLSNDYKVEVTSDQQTDNALYEPRPVFRTMVRAEGNVKDHSNLGAVAFDYGLPTATQVLGLTVEADDLAGFRLYGEYNVNHQYRKYPDVSRTTHTTSSGIQGNPSAEAWMVNVARDFHPYYVFGEAFSMDAEYSTTMRFVDSAGRVNYANTPLANSRYLYDLVDDNDDNDRKNDQKRMFDDGRTGGERGSGIRRGFEGYADEAVFPGLDENNDFISDFNQNNTRVRPNNVPDYAEPFLRYSVDRPEYLFSIDMNNNGWGDRFENDNEPDYPYKRDRRGFNVYGGAWIMPGAKVTAGHQFVRRPSTGETNVSSYALFAFERSYPDVGELRVYDMLKRVADDIADDLFQWLHGRFRDGGMTPIPDPLGMRNTWVNKLSLGFERLGNTGINSENKLIYEVVRQREEFTVDREGRKISKHTRRLGLINKLGWLCPVGNGIQLRPRVKQELFLDDTPFNTEWLLNDRVFERKEWAGMASLRLDIPVLRHSTVIVGLEQLIFRDFAQREVAFDDDPVAGLNRGDRTGDFNELSLALQLTNASDYKGYRLIATIGIRVDRRKIDRFARKDRLETSGLSYFTVYGGQRE
jgi:hypothetical protein